MVPTTTAVFVEKGHGRLVRYTLQTPQACNPYLQQELSWPKVGQTLALQRQATCLKTGQVTTERHYALTDLSPDQASPATLFRLWRQPWHVENKLHWVRDVVFDEDLRQAWRGSGPFNLSLLRNAVISLFRLYGYPHITDTRTYFSVQVQMACSFVGIPLE